MIKATDIAERIYERLNLDGIPCRMFGAEENDDGTLRPFVICEGRLVTISVGAWDDWSKFEETYATFNKYILMDKEIRREHIGTA